MLTNWKALAFVPLFFVVIAVMILANNLAETGSVISRDVELSGGKQISFEIKGGNVDALKNAFPYAKFNVAEGAVKTLLAEMPFDSDENVIISYVKANFETEGEPSVRNIGPALGGVFWQQTQVAFAVALLMMSLLVFILYRSLVPSVLIIVSAVSDIIIIIAILSIVGIDFSLPILGAILMILGYGTDNNILLTSHMLKFKTVALKDVFRTSVMMYATTVCALVSIYLVSGSFVLQQIALTLLIGLFVDMPVTWLTNAGLLRMWLEKHGR